MSNQTHRASMAEWSKAVDSSSTGRMPAWVRTPLDALFLIPPYPDLSSQMLIFKISKIVKSNVKGFFPGNSVDTAFTFQTSVSDIFIL